jgi:hypothetical protein
MVGRLAGVAVALALAACGKVVQPVPGPLDRIYKPTGLAVLHSPINGDPRLVVVSANGDLQYDSDTGGSVIGLESFEGDFTTTGYRITGAVNVKSFGGDLAIADPAVCGTVSGVFDPSSATSAEAGTVAALFATRGSSTLNKIRVGRDGGITCADCGIPLSGTFTDPLPVAVACQPQPGGRASAFIGYMQGHLQEGWVTEYSLRTGALTHLDVGYGPVRNLTYDAARDRLYILGLATGGHTPLRYVDLKGCTIGAPLNGGGCIAHYAQEPVSLSFVEERAMALAAPVAGRPQRAYLTGRIYDPGAAASAGARTNDLGGKLFVVDLVEGPFGVVVQLVDELDIGHGAQDVRVLPAAPAWSAGRGDVIAALSVDDSFLWVYDTETRSVGKIGRNPVTGAALAGGQPYGLAVDPEPVASVARLYLGAYADSNVIPIDVPLEDVTAVDFAGTSRTFITGAP